jgi:hypothetical protein
LTLDPEIVDRHQTVVDGNAGDLRGATCVYPDDHVPASESSGFMKFDPLEDILPDISKVELETRIAV